MKYNPDRRCPKCNHDFVKTRYGGQESYPVDELIRECIRCGYRWTEDPLDSPKEDKP